MEGWVDTLVSAQPSFARGGDRPALDSGYARVAMTQSFQLPGSPGSTWEMRLQQNDPRQKGNGAKAGYEGIVEDVKGKLKGIIGRVTRRPDVEAEHRTQRHT
jgi:hypothetical protein